MQEAIDIPTIAATYYNKTVAPVPVGVITTAWTGWMVPYAQWPQALKDEYTYNPTAAKALLAAAGYPNGFSTNVIAPTNYDLDYLQIYKAYFAAIGINMTIKTTDPTSWLNILIAGSQDQILYNQVDGMLNPPSRLIQRFYSKAPAATNPSFYGDPAFDTIFNNFMVATDLAKQKALLQQSDLYNISNFIQMNSVPLVEYIIYQPWFKGYTGQVFYYWAKVSFARYWIDQPLKKSMGY
jgi:ABC-type transport system substrate-binding protein